MDSGQWSCFIPSASLDLGPGWVRRHLDYIYFVFNNIHLFDEGNLVCLLKYFATFVRYGHFSLITRIEFSTNPGIYGSVDFA